MGGASKIVSKTKKCFLLVSLLVFLFSCQKEMDEGNRVKPEQLIGEWQWESTIVVEVSFDNFGNVISSNIVDTIYPYDAFWGVDFTCSFEVKENGDVLLFKEDYLFQKIKSKKMRYGRDANPDLKKYYTIADRVNDKGVYQRLDVLNYYPSQYSTVHGFPIDGGVDGNEFSVIYKNMRDIYVYNIFKRK